VGTVRLSRAGARRLTSVKSLKAAGGRHSLRRLLYTRQGRCIHTSKRTRFDKYICKADFFYKRKNGHLYEVYTNGAAPRRVPGPLHRFVRNPPTSYTKASDKLIRRRRAPYTNQGHRRRTKTRRGGRGRGCENFEDTAGSALYRSKASRHGPP
jgi:hypothetical protein